MYRHHDNTLCPLCRHKRIETYFADRTRRYLRCHHCCLVFVPECEWLGAEEEKAVYDLHRNDPQDRGYRQFLSRLSAPLIEKLGPPKQGLDFGCGPGPTLSLMLEAQGHRVDLFDPIYQCNDEVFSRSYDFICATEVVEHLRNPDATFSVLFTLLKKGGWLGIMTKLVLNRTAFGAWHYIRDLTHICFYSGKTFEYLSRRYNAEMQIVGKDVILLKKK